MKIFDFLKSDFSYLPSGKTRKAGCLKMSDVSESDFSYLALWKTRKVGCEKSEKKTSAISKVYLQYPGRLEVQNCMVGSVGVK